MKTKMTTNPSTERKVATFLSVKDANRWLRKRDSIVILNLRVKCNRNFSPYHPMIRKIIIDYISYPHPVNITYGIEKTEYLRKRESGSHDSYSDKWSRKNPKKEFVLCEKKTSELYFFGNKTGPLFLIKETFFVLYKTEKNKYQLQDYVY